MEGVGRDGKGDEGIGRERGKKGRGGEMKGRGNEDIPSLQISGYAREFY